MTYLHHQHGSVEYTVTWRVRHVLLELAWARVSADAWDRVGRHIWRRVSEQRMRKAAT